VLEARIEGRVEGIYRGFGQAGGAHLGRVGVAIERATGRRCLARSTRDESINHSAFFFASAIHAHTALDI
jgi:hypothetical protein